MLQAEQYIDQKAMMSWIQNWDESMYIDYFEQQIKDRHQRLRIRSSMEENIVKIKKLCADMQNQFDFHAFLQFMNRIIFNCYFKAGNSALRIANYYEEILVPADHNTRQSLFAYQDGQKQTGQLNVIYQGVEIGQFGEQSDMFHLIFDACFHAEEELYDEDTPKASESVQLPFFRAGEDSILTLKIWQPALLQDDLDYFVDLFLYHCSNKLGLSLKRASFEMPWIRRKEPINQEIQVQSFYAEKLPLLYFNAASHNLPPEIIYMSYYQVLSYFFDRAVHQVIHEKMQSMFDLQEVKRDQELRRMAKAVNTIRERYNEKETLQMILKPVVNLDEIMIWLNLQTDRYDWFTQVQSNYSDLPLLILSTEKELMRSLVERLYAIKSTISEVPDQTEQFVWIQNLNQEVFQHEIPLIKLLAGKTLELWSIPSKT